MATHIALNPTDYAASTNTRRILAELPRARRNVSKTEDTRLTRYPKSATNMADP